MEQVIKILEEIKPGIDYSRETDLIGDKILDSLKIVQLVSELNDEFDIEMCIRDSRNKATLYTERRHGGFPDGEEDDSSRKTAKN